MKKSLSIIILSAFCCILAASALATVPKLINYSGKLTDKAGNVLPDKAYDIRFSLWTAQTGGTEDWWEEHYITQVRGVQTYGGGFNVVLGGTRPFPVFDQNYWLQLTVTINSTPETFSRQELITVPYAMRAEWANEAKTVEDNAITHAKIAPGADLPIGSIIAWHKNLGGVPSLPPQYVECNGQALNDPSSLLNGQIIPNLNGEGRFLRGSNVAGTMQADELKSHNHQVISSWPSATCTEWHVVADWMDPGEGVTWENWGPSLTHTGGSETRPINMSVVWIMKIK